MVNGGKVNCWICINFAPNVPEGLASSFCYQLALMCQTSGMVYNAFVFLISFSVILPFPKVTHSIRITKSTLLLQEFSLNPIFPPLSARPNQMEQSLKALYVDAMNILLPQKKQLDLLIVILPDNNGSLYGRLSCELL